MQRHGYLWSLLELDEGAFPLEEVGVVADAGVNLLSFDFATVAHLVEPAAVDVGSELGCQHLTSWRRLEDLALRLVEGRPLLSLRLRLLAQGPVAQCDEVGEGVKPVLSLLQRLTGVVVLLLRVLKLSPDKRQVGLDLVSAR